MQTHRLRFSLPILVLFLATFLHAQTPEHHQPPPDAVPSFLVTGINAYRSVGPEAAIKAWTEFSALAESKDAADQAAYLHQVQGFYGPLEGYDFVASRILTPRTRVIYLAFNYERGPLFAKFVIYRSSQRWLLASMDFNLKEEMILPPSTSE
ncbi:MAG: hypothetical protein PW789_09700 [Edaphobacter sp.]|uniref:hypothetical protein n=1 Tax=Edaphobacter sp. TaxID=1934404 RepID=UPI00239F6332|nr:hypothetical protein [Edaphobacter sp.]MDE1176868.1 hypothetical protein [Edaphobacter sp.]